MLSIVSFSAAFVAPATHTSEVWGRAQTEAAGVVWRGNSSAQSSHDLLADVELPKVCTSGAPALAWSSHPPSCASRSP